MSTTLQRPLRPYSGAGDAAPLDSTSRDPRFQAYLTMRIGYTVLPLAMGIDKFFNAMVSWPQYLADWVDTIVPGTAQQFMYAVGVIEIAAGLLMLVRPRYGAYLVGAWLVGIVINLLSYGEWYDVAVRDFGLMLGAFALARLASVYDRGWFRP